MGADFRFACAECGFDCADDGWDEYWSLKAKKKEFVEKEKSEEKKHKRQEKSGAIKSVRSSILQPRNAFAYSV